MVVKRCVICGNNIRVKEAHVKRGWGKYCSKKCQAVAQHRGKWVPCGYCGKSIYRTPRDFRKSRSKKFFCSVGCHCSWENENRRCGENAPNWVAGHNVYRRLMVRHGIEKRCYRCGHRDERVLVVHHRDRNRRNNNIENLGWLCRNCHCIEHVMASDVVAIV